MVSSVSENIKFISGTGIIWKVSGEAVIYSNMLHIRQIIGVIQCRLQEESSWNTEIKLASRNISWPMMFEIRNPKNFRSTNGGVLEFISEEGTCNIPYWIMQNLELNEGDVVTITNVSLPKAKWVKLKPLNDDYWDISNPRAVLENALRNYATLTTGDVIPIHYLQTVYLIEIVDLKPARACSIIETDMEVDFDVQMPEPKQSVEKTVTEAEIVAGKRLDGKTPKLTKQTEETVNKTPWENKLPNGIRTRDPEFDWMVQNNRIPYVKKNK
ncbi:ubiquitin fusion degradation protein [Theileria orientalis strain Shintoku]|uniref:Ubiquitin fusion degradation protein n=1 Tax=Theileria orientalis strain Shintoku TaxID=869250 RepID=J4DP82_THEOR|nr:ubiquitin fusion degradation protein [Theileria orientalis strain Shintoku]BAM40254.1 ubiquitin fusion degradation protein [Theileria orientalis strain Shintoku]|eukprot:XP_009690555.1 ubiquitin fusion degradation protein [Theileria orientalis strain Shintoku]